MNATTNELDVISLPLDVAELNEAQLALVGGGIGDVIFG